MKITQIFKTEIASHPLLIGATLLSGVAFTLFSFTARLFTKGTLPDLIQLQTTTVFLAFLVQAGLRAGMRNQYHLGRRRLVQAAEDAIFKHLPWVTLLVSLLSMLQNYYAVVPAFAILHAALTLLIGLRIAQSRMRSAAIYSLFTFLSIATVCGLLMLSNKPLMDLRLVIETTSILCLVLLGRDRTLDHRSLLSLKKLLISGFGLQVGAFAVYGFGFLLGTYVVFLSQQNLSAAVAFADVQVICGVQSLLFSRVFLLVEGKLIRLGKIHSMTNGLIVYSIVFSLIILGIASIYVEPSLALLYSALSFSILSRQPLAIIFQFIRNEFRAESLVLAALLSAALGAATYFHVDESLAWAAVVAFSPGIVALLLSMRARITPRAYFLSGQRAPT